MRHKRSSSTRTESVPVILLALTDDQEQSALRSLLEPAGWRVECVNGPDQAAAFLESTAAVATIVPYRSEGASSWRSLLDDSRSFKSAPCVVVTDRCADERMWAEVLSLGGYDVLVQPFEAREVNYVLASALRFQSGSVAHAA